MIDRTKAVEECGKLMKLLRDDGAASEGTLGYWLELKRRWIALKKVMQPKDDEKGFDDEA